MLISFTENYSLENLKITLQSEYYDNCNSRIK